MNNGKTLERFRALLGARLLRGQGSGSSRPGTRGTLGSDSTGPAASSASETWQDGTPRDPEAAILARFDEERFAVDAEYQGRPEIQTLAARLVEVRRQKAAGQPHPEIVRAGDGVPTQADYEAGKGALLKAERRAQLDAEIRALEEMRAALEGGDE